MGTHGWPFATVDQFPGADADPLYKSEHVRDLYLKADPDYGGRFDNLFGDLKNIDQADPPVHQVHRSCPVGQEEPDYR